VKLSVGSQVQITDAYFKGCEKRGVEITEVMRQPATVTEISGRHFHIQMSDGTMRSARLTE
jgi:hypothetical protein